MQITEHAGKRILFVMAIDAEYGDCLKQRFVPLFTGVGPVEAAIRTASVLAELAASGSLPDIVVSLGSAGSARLEQTRVYQASSVSYRDMDASPLGFEKGKTPFLELPAEVALEFQIDGLPKARLSTGANIVSGEAYASIDADMVDMETFAVLRACMMHDLPLVALRGISDGADELHQFDDWTRYLHVVDENLAEAVDQLFAALASGRVTA